MSVSRNQFQQEFKGRIGRTWQESGKGMTNQFVTALVPRPGAPNTLYAGTNGGVFKTTDAGDHWKPVRLVPEESAAEPANLPAH